MKAKKLGLILMLIFPLMLIAPEDTTTEIPTEPKKSQASEIKEFEMLNNFEKSKTTKEAADELVEKLLTNFAEIFQKFADLIGSAMVDSAKARDDKNAEKFGEIIKKLPATARDMGLIIWSLLGKVVTKQFVADIQSLYASLQCTFISKTKRPTLKDKQGNPLCADLDTLQKALVASLDRAKVVWMPFLSAMMLGIDFNGKPIKGLLPLGISLIDPTVDKDMDIVVQIANILVNSMDQLKIILSAGMNRSTEEKTETAKKEETKEAPKEVQVKPAPALSNPTNSKLRADLIDLKVVAASGAAIAKILPEKKVIKGYTLNFRQAAELIAALLYNIAEMGLAVEAVVEGSKKLKNVTDCLKYSEVQLSLAAKNGSSDTLLASCAQAGCASKKECVSYVVRNIGMMMDSLIGPVFAQYNPETKKAERGFLLNGDALLDLILKTIIESKAAESWEPARKEKAQKFLKNTEDLRSVAGHAAQVMKDVIRVIYLIADILAPKTVPADEEKKVKDELDEAKGEQIAANSEAEKDLDKVNLPVTA